MAPVAVELAPVAVPGVEARAVPGVALVAVVAPAPAAEVPAALRRAVAPRRVPSSVGSRRPVRSADRSTRPTA